jgi:hypothetical protein
LLTLAVADHLGSASLLTSVRTSFVHGMDTALLEERKL